MTKAALAKKVKEFQASRAKGAACYRKAGELLSEIRTEAGVGQPIDCGKSGVFQVVDQFAAKDVLFKQTACERYAIERVE